MLLGWNPEIGRLLVNTISDLAKMTASPVLPLLLAFILMDGINGASMVAKVVGSIVYVIAPGMDVFVMAGKFTLFKLANVIGDLIVIVLGLNIGSIVTPVPNIFNIIPELSLEFVSSKRFRTVVVEVNCNVIPLDPSKCCTGEEEETLNVLPSIETVPDCNGILTLV